LPYRKHPTPFIPEPQLRTQGKIPPFAKIRTAATGFSETTFRHPVRPEMAQKQLFF